MTTSSSGTSTQSRLFYLTDRHSGTRFLVDTGADVSVIPPTLAEKNCPSLSRSLQAVNKTSITTYGEKSLTLDIGLCRTFRWIFIIADLPLPTLGADFLAHFRLKVDITHRLLIDRTTNLHINGVQATDSSPHSIYALPDASSPYIVTCNSRNLRTRITRIVPSSMTSHTILTLLDLLPFVGRVAWDQIA
eukprot:gene5062-biopygen4119